MCSQYFKPSDFKPPDNNGRRLLEEGVNPTTFYWSKERKEKETAPLSSVRISSHFGLSFEF